MVGGRFLTAQQRYVIRAIELAGSEEALGRALGGVGQSTISKWANQRKVVPIRRLWELCRLFSWSAAEVFHDCDRDIRLLDDLEFEELAEQETMNLRELVVYAARHKLEPDHTRWSTALSAVCYRVRYGWDWGKAGTELTSFALMHYIHGLTVTARREDVLRATATARSELASLGRTERGWVSQAAAWTDMVCHRLARDATPRALDEFLDVGGGKLLKRQDPIVETISLYDAMLLAADLGAIREFEGLRRLLTAAADELNQASSDQLNQQWAAIAYGGVARGAAILFAKLQLAGASPAKLDRLLRVADDSRRASEQLLPTGDTIARLRVSRLPLTFLEMGLVESRDVKKYVVLRRELQGLARRLGDVRTFTELGAGLARAG